jgi:hypothetical protein
MKAEFLRQVLFCPAPLEQRPHPLPELRKEPHRAAFLLLIVYRREMRALLRPVKGALASQP